MLSILGLLCVSGNLAIPIGYYYQKFILKTEPKHASMIPFIGGIALTCGVLLCPADLPMNRIALAVIALLLDLSILLLPISLVLIIKGEPNQ